jgi:hypothetical protein
VATARTSSFEPAGRARATVFLPDSERAAAPAARRSVSDVIEDDGPSPTVTTSGALTAPPDGSLQTSPTLADAPMAARVLAKPLPNAVATSAAPGAGTSPESSECSPMTTASALTVRGEVVRSAVVVTDGPHRLG